MWTFNNVTRLHLKVGRDVSGSPTGEAPAKNIINAIVINKISYNSALKKYEDDLTWGGVMRDVAHTVQVESGIEHVTPEKNEVKISRR